MPEREVVEGCGSINGGMHSWHARCVHGGTLESCEWFGLMGISTNHIQYFGSIAPHHRTFLLPRALAFLVSRLHFISQEKENIPCRRRIYVEDFFHLCIALDSFLLLRAGANTCRSAWRFARQAERARASSEAEEGERQGGILLPHSARCSLCVHTCRVRSYLSDCLTAGEIKAVDRR